VAKAELPDQERYEGAATPRLSRRRPDAREQNPTEALGVDGLTGWRHSPKYAGEIIDAVHLGPAKGVRHRPQFDVIEREIAR
jgi:hypothetical protein